MQDLDQAKLIALIAAIALRSFLGESRAQMKNAEVDEVYRRLVRWPNAITRTDRAPLP